MIPFVDFTKENIKEHNPNQLHIPNNPCRILIIRGLVCGKTSALFNLIGQELDIDKMFLYAKDPYEAKY